MSNVIPMPQAHSLAYWTNAARFACAVQDWDKAQSALLEACTIAVSHRPDLVVIFAELSLTIQAKQKEASRGKIHV